MKPTLRSNYAAVYRQTHDCVDPFPQRRYPEPCLVGDPQGHLQQALQALRLGYDPQHRSPARMAVPTAERLGFRKRESQHGFSFFSARKKNMPYNRRGEK